MTFSVASFLSNAIAKPIIAGGVAAGLDHFVMKTNNPKASAMFGAAVGGGIASVAWIGPVVSPMFPTKTPFGAIGKNLEERILEVGVGAPVAYAINRFVFKNEFNYADIYKKLGIVVVADLVGETLCEMLLLV